jgi:hypothetical protein
VTASGAKLRQKMRQFMPQGAIDLVGAVTCQPRVQGDQQTLCVSAPSAGPKPAVPFHANTFGKRVASQTSEQPGGCLL